MSGHLFHRHQRVPQRDLLRARRPIPKPARKGESPWPVSGQKPPKGTKR